MTLNTYPTSKSPAFPVVQEASSSQRLGSSPSLSESNLSEQNDDGGSKIWITGIGIEYPPHVIHTDAFDQTVAMYHPDWKTNPGLSKLVAINKKTGIQTRAAISPLLTAPDSNLPNIPLLPPAPQVPSPVQISTFFRHHAINLTASACTAALHDSSLPSFSLITHTVAGTCTDQGNPGFDLLVNDRLPGLSPHTPRVLLDGVGCAGGITLLRTAMQLAWAATARNQPARILVYTCELCSAWMAGELRQAAETAAEEVGVAAALFSDGAAAFVLCNDLGRKWMSRDGTCVKTMSPLFEAVEFGCGRVPETIGEMSLMADGRGNLHAHISRSVPQHTASAVLPLFKSLMPSYLDLTRAKYLTPLDFDWAMHPGGAAILLLVAKKLGLSAVSEEDTDLDPLRASWEVYRKRGNSSSVTVWSVIQCLRKGGLESKDAPDGSSNGRNVGQREHGSTRRSMREHVVATAFGPGLMIEMAFLRRCERVQREAAGDINGADSAKQ